MAKNQVVTDTCTIYTTDIFFHFFKTLATNIYRSSITAHPKMHKTAILTKVYLNFTRTCTSKLNAVICYIQCFAMFAKFKLTDWDNSNIVSQTFLEYQLSNSHQL